MSATGASDRGPLPALCVVVVNWNGRDLLDDCLGSVLAGGYRGLRLILVDNDSRDDSVAFVRSRYPGVEVLVAPRNLRWAGGNNLALGLLARQGWPQDQVLLLNNDTIVPEGCLQRLAVALRDDPRAWAATPRIAYADRPDLLWYDGGKVGAWSGWIRHEGIRRPLAARPLADRAVEYGSGCALLLSRRALRHCGLLDEAYHFYGEDVDYCLRLRAAGGVVLHVPQAVLLHKVSRSLGAASPQKIYLRSRSHLRLLRRHWPRRRWPVLAAAQAVYLGAHACWHLWSGRHETALALGRGLLDEWRGRPVAYGGLDAAEGPMVP